MNDFFEVSGEMSEMRPAGMSPALTAFVLHRGGSRRERANLRPRLLLILGLFSTALSVSAATAEARLPEDSFPLLEQILRDSVDSSWRMVEEGLRVEEAEAEANVAGAGRYPSVTGRFRYSGRIEDRDDFDRTRSFYQPQAGLTARQPLYHWGALQANNRIGLLRTAIAEGNRAEAFRGLALAIRADFLGLAVQQKEIDLAEKRRELAQQELAVAERTFEDGGITAEELRIAQLAAREAILGVERLRRERELAIEQFSRTIGFNPVGDEWTPYGIPPVSPGSLGEGALSGEGHRPREEVSLLRIDQAEEQVAVERVRRRPRLDLVAGVAQDQVAVFDRADIDRTVYFAGVELIWNIFDGHETRGRKAAALARARFETKRHERQEREATAELERLQEAVDWAARELELSEERLELAGRSLSQRKEDLERGLISETEMVAAGVTQSEWELAANRRRAEYLMAVAEFLSAAGLDPAMDFYLSRQR